MHEPTIPPATRYRFERLAFDICNQAKVDHPQWTAQMTELRNHLEQKWIEGVEEFNLNTETAEKRAIDLLDSNSAVKSLKRPIWYRSLFYQRYRSERFFFILLVPLADAAMGIGRTFLEIAAKYSLSAQFFFLKISFRQLAPIMGVLGLLVASRMVGDDSISIFKTQWWRKPVAVGGYVAAVWAFIVGFKAYFIDTLNTFTDGWAKIDFSLMPNIVWGLFFLFFISLVVWGCSCFLFEFSGIVLRKHTTSLGKFLLGLSRLKTIPRNRLSQ